MRGWGRASGHTREKIFFILTKFSAKTNGSSYKVATEYSLVNQLAYRLSTVAGTWQISNLALGCYTTTVSVWHEIFTDCQFFAFRRNKFSRIWTSDFTTGSKFPWQVHVQYFSMVLVILFTVNLIEIQGSKYKWSKFADCFFSKEFIFTGFNFNNKIK